MKEATGEANMTIVTVVLIGIVTVIATPIITSLVKSSKNRACCVNDGGQWKNGQCLGDDGTKMQFSCDDDEKAASSGTATEG